MGYEFSPNGTLLTSSNWTMLPTPDTTGGRTTPGMPAAPAPAPPANSYAKDFQRAGLIMAVMGGINQAIGSFYQAKQAQYQAKSQALNYDFQSDEALINASAAERDAQSIIKAGQSQIARYTMEAGQRKSEAKASLAAHGVVLGEGSARDVVASMDLVKDIDTLTINANAARAAEAERAQAQNLRSQSLLYRTSGNNARRTAASISTGMAAATSLLGSASNVAYQWLWQKNGRGE